MIVGSDDFFFLSTMGLQDDQRCNVVTWVDEELIRWKLHRRRQEICGNSALRKMESGLEDDNVIYNHSGNWCLEL